MRLSDRLNTIASYIKKGESIADIGTDHALLPIFLWKHGICSKIIISDINEGPLEKARANINRLCPDMDVDIRIGNGLNNILKNEVNSVIIAGMGGLLIIDILGYDIDKSRSFDRFILQPRNASDKLRIWLYENNFNIHDEKLVLEGKYICEVIEVKPNTSNKTSLMNQDLLKEKESNLEFEINPILFRNKDPLLKEFIKRKKEREEFIINEILAHGSDESKKNLVVAKERLNRLQYLMEICE